MKSTLDSQRSANHDVDNSTRPGLASLTENLLTRLQVAKHLAIEPRTLESWRTRGLGPKYVRYGRRSVRYRPSDVVQWVLDHTSPKEPR